MFFIPSLYLHSKNVFPPGSRFHNVLAKFKIPISNAGERDISIYIYITIFCIYIYIYIYIYMGDTQLFLVQIHPCPTHPSTDSVYFFFYQ